jgi:alcohol dehydrogenase
MKAVVLREHGEGGLRYETDFPDPVPGAGDVVVRVRAASLNYHDIFTRRGTPRIKIPMPAVMGLDVAGEIAATGLGVSTYSLEHATEALARLQDRQVFGKLVTVP